MSEADHRAISAIELTGDWSEVLQGPARETLEETLPSFLKAQRWFGGKAKKIDAVQFVDWASFPAESRSAFLTWLEVRFVSGEADHYFLPLVVSAGRDGIEPTAIVARLKAPAGDAVLHDALVDDEFCRALLEAVGRAASVVTQHGGVRAEATSAFAELRGDSMTRLTPTLGPPTSSNSLVFYGDRLLLKLFRRLEVGVNPDYEIGRFLTENQHFDRLPRVAGAIEYCPTDGRCPLTLGIVQQLVPNEGDGWQHALGELSRYYDRTIGARQSSIPRGTRPLLSLVETTPPAEIAETIGNYLQAARSLGRRTAEMHLALASDTHDDAFAMEPITAADVASVRREILEQGRKSFRLLEDNLKTLPPEVMDDATRVLDGGIAAVERATQHAATVPKAAKTRVHGDYHLGQVLWVGGDYIILDFEGEPTRTIEERREKFSPMRDVAGMLRSYHYAAYAGLFAVTKERPKDFGRLLPWAELWQRTVSATFLAEYMKTAGEAAFLPKDRDEFANLLNGFMLAKALYELSYELNNRPDWVRIPLGGVIALLEKTP